MAINVNEVFATGGKTLIDFLEFCVLSVEMDPVFAFVILEYRREPTLPRALTMYDMFCAPSAPARISLVKLLPPKQLGLQADLAPLRAQWEQFLNTEPDEKRPVPRQPSPPRYLFDHLAEPLTTTAARVGERFDPALAPLEQLPDGRMSGGQRAFVENVWRPVVRARLVSAGFRRISNIGS